MPDKIYSRKRFKFYRVKWSKNFENEKKSKRIKNVFIVCIIALLTALIIIQQLNPVFNAVCSAKAKALATEIINMESSMAFKDINYEDLVNIVKDSERKYWDAKNKYRYDKHTCFKYCIQYSTKTV